MNVLLKTDVHVLSICILLWSCNSSSMRAGKSIGAVMSNALDYNRMHACTGIPEILFKNKSIYMYTCACDCLGSAFYPPSDAAGDKHSYADPLNIWMCTEQYL